MKIMHVDLHVHFNIAKWRLTFTRNFLKTAIPTKFLKVFQEILCSQREKYSLSKAKTTTQNN